LCFEYWSTVESDDVNANICLYSIESPEFECLLPKRDLESLGIVIVLDWHRPDLFIHNLLQWIDVITRYCNTRYEAETLEKTKTKLKTFVQSVNFHPLDSNDTGLPLEKGHLSINLGLPLFIAVDNSELIPTLENDLGEDTIDCIQQMLRTVCIACNHVIIHFRWCVTHIPYPNETRNF
jgi:hypothetical protein